MKPHWKTLVITDPATEAWIGQLQYVRTKPTQTMSTGTPADWCCKIMLPAEIYDQVMEAWSKGWHPQFPKQY